MLNLKTVHSVKDLSKDDLLVTISKIHGWMISRVDCIDGEDIYIIPPHANVKTGNEVGHYKTTISELLLKHQVMKITDEETQA